MLPAKVWAELEKYLTEFCNKCAKKQDVINCDYCLDIIEAREEWLAQWESNEEDKADRKKGN